VIVGIPVRVIFQCHLSIGALEAGIIAVPRYPEYFVIVALGRVHF
jgi:hypothetical protein